MKQTAKKTKLAQKPTKSNEKKRQRPNPSNAVTKKRKVDVEYEELGNMDSWDWSEVPTSSSAMMTDELSGFLCLEEIDDVEVEYVGDDTVGKIAKFKRAKKADRRPGKRAAPEEPLNMEDMGEFYDIDTFDEEAAAKDKEQKRLVDKKMTGKKAQPAAEYEPEEEEKDDSEGLDAKMEMPEEQEKDDSEGLDAKIEVPGKAMKKTQKEKKLERLKKQIAKLEASIAAENNEDNEGDNKDKDEDANMDEEENVVVESKAGTKATDGLKATKRRPTAGDVDQSIDVSAWESFNLAEPIMNALKYHKFLQPTPIQEKTIPRALDGRNIIGAAETGSGKTLAFGMPIVQYILNTNEKSDALVGLILTPTRELAIQVKDHIENIAIFTPVKVAAIVGGMSMQKQQRVLKNNPNIVVATPGRMWEIFSGNASYMDMLKHIKFLVLDEADRMLEKGRFEELSNILDTLSNKKKDTTDWPEESEDAKTKVVSRVTTDYQTFVFTATLSKELRFHKSKKAKAKKSAAGSMQHLLERLDLVSKNPAIIDITTETAVASRLLEAKIDCLKTDKDLFVYYFVTRYPGRTIVFVNSIDAIRRLIPVFKLLGVEVLGLHAQMQQRQRLKNLDRFKMNDKAVLVASDVAARGLDIPLVEHVIHYQLPRSGEIYVHRSGRTARANRDGVSLLLCGPDEVKLYTKLCHALRKGEQYPDFPVDLGILNEMKKRVNLAVEIDKLEHRDQKEAHEDNWLRRMAEQMDVEYDDDEQGEDGNKGSKNKAKIYSKKAELKQLLAMPMLPFGISRKYFTGGQVEGLADLILENSKKATLLPAHASTQAKEDLFNTKKSKN